MQGRCIGKFVGSHGQRQSQYAELLVAHENTHHVIGQSTPLRFNASMRIIFSALQWQWLVSTVALPQKTTIAVAGSAPGHAYVNDYEFDGSNFTVTNAEFGDAGKYIFQSSASDSVQKVRWTAYAVIIGKFILYINHMLR